MRPSSSHALVLEGGLHPGEGVDLLLVQLAVHSVLGSRQKAEINNILITFLASGQVFWVCKRLRSANQIWGRVQGADLIFPIGSLVLINFIANFCC